MILEYKAGAAGNSPKSKPKRVNFYIDGMNVYHRIRKHWKSTGRDYRWLDYRRLCEKVLRPDEVAGEIYFFTAIKKEKVPPSSIGRHQLFIRAMKARGLSVKEGVFSKYGKEKQTDINIAIHMVSDALLNKCDKCVLVSADSDFIPALRMVSDLRKGAVETLWMPPPHSRRVAGLQKAVQGRVIGITFDAFKGCALPQKIETASGQVIRKPKEYQVF